MATGEQLLHEAQYAFQSITFGESRENKRNASRAKSLCKKIIRKYPASTEAAEAHAILRRLGEEAYISEMPSRHRHVPQSVHHKASSPTPQPQSNVGSDSEVVAFDWEGLFNWLFSLPKAILAVGVIGVIFLFGIFGPLLLVPPILFILLTGPLRQILKPEQRKDLNAFIVRANAYIENQRI